MTIDIERLAVAVATTNGHAAKTPLPHVFYPKKLNFAVIAANAAVCPEPFAMTRAGYADSPAGANSATRKIPFAGSKIPGLGQ